MKIKVAQQDARCNIPNPIERDDGTNSVIRISIDSITIIGRMRRFMAMNSWMMRYKYDRMTDAERKKKRRKTKINKGIDRNDWLAWQIVLTLGKIVHVCILGCHRPNSPNKFQHHGTASSKSVCKWNSGKFPFDKFDKSQWIMFIRNCYAIYPPRSYIHCQSVKLNFKY